MRPPRSAGVLRSEDMQSPGTPHLRGRPRPQVKTRMKLLLPLVAVLLLGGIVWLGARALRVQEMNERVASLSVPPSDADLDAAHGAWRALRADADEMTARQRDRLDTQGVRLLPRLLKRDLRVTRRDGDEAPVTWAVAAAAPYRGRDRIALRLALDASSPLAEGETLGFRLGDQDARYREGGWDVDLVPESTQGRAMLEVRSGDRPALALSSLPPLLFREDLRAPEIQLVVNDQPLDPQDDVVTTVHGPANVALEISDDGPIVALSLQWNGQDLTETIAPELGGAFLRHNFELPILTKEEGQLEIAATDVAGNRSEALFRIYRDLRPLPSLREMAVRGAITRGDLLYVGGTQALEFSPVLEGAPGQATLLLRRNDQATKPFDLSEEGSVVAMSLEDIPDGETILTELKVENEDTSDRLWSARYVVDHRPPEVILETVDDGKPLVLRDLTVMRGRALRLRLRDLGVGAPRAHFDDATTTCEYVAEESAASTDATWRISFPDNAPSPFRLVLEAQDALGNRGAARTWTFTLREAPPEDDGRHPRMTLMAGDREVDVDTPLVFRAGDVPALSVRLEDPSGLVPERVSCRGATLACDEVPEGTIPEVLLARLLNPRNGPLELTIEDRQGRKTTRGWDLTVVDAQAEIVGEAIANGEVVFGAGPRAFRVKLSQPPPSGHLSAQFVRRDGGADPIAISTLKGLNGEIANELENVAGDWDLEITLDATNGRKSLVRLPVRSRSEK